jgi:hypothetical protein
MGALWEGVGFTRFPMGLCFLVVVLLGFWSSLKLFRPGAAADQRRKAWLDGVLTWGYLALISGIVGLFIGVILAIQGAEAAGSFASPQAARGIRASLLNATFAPTILGFSVFLWWILQIRWRLLRMAAGEEGS